MSINVVEEKKKFLIDFFSVFCIFFIFVLCLDWIHIWRYIKCVQEFVRHGVHSACRLSNIIVVVRIRNSNLFFTSCNGISSLVTMFRLVRGVRLCSVLSFWRHIRVVRCCCCCCCWCMLCFLHHYEARRWYWCDMRIIHLFISSESGRGRTSIKYYCIHIFIRRTYIPILYTWMCDASIWKMP